jgi:dimeric dUTPase (all-alpha-NTP-PPase superfamily)
VYEFRDALRDQHELQIASYKKDPVGLDEETRTEFIRWNVLALEDELHEALGEVGWKPWATSRHLNREPFKKELVDALHFFMNLMLAADIDADELLDAYQAKREVNAKRQADGYDGVAGKCPRCSRALEDVPPTYSKVLCGICELNDPR